MATHQSDLIAAKEGAGKISDRWVPGDRVAGILLQAVATYTILGTELSNDIVDLVDLPAGAEAVPQMSFVTCNDPGTALTVDIGDSDNVDGLADGIDLKDGGTVQFMSGTAPSEALAPVRAGSGGRRIKMTLVSVNTLNAGAKIVVFIAFRAKA